MSNLERRALAREWLERMGLGARMTHLPSQLSGGQQQRVAIARAIVGRPKMLLADEPTGNLDSRTGEKIMQLMFDLNRSSSTTLVLVTHDNGLAERCDRMLALDTGRLVRDTGIAA